MVFINFVKLAKAVAKKKEVSNTLDPSYFDKDDPRLYAKDPSISIYGNPVQQALRDYIGKYYFAPTNMLISNRALEDSNAPANIDKNLELIKNMKKHFSKELDDTAFNLGGGDVIDSYFYKKERGKPLSFFERIGGRFLQNKKMSTLGKLTYPVVLPLSMILDSANVPGYDPGTDVIHMGPDMYGWNSNTFGQAGYINKHDPLTRDLRGFGYLIPGTGIRTEDEANAMAESLAAVNATYKNNSKAKNILLKEREKELAVQAAQSAAGEADPTGGIASMLIGRIYGSMDKGKKKKNEKPFDYKPYIDPLVAAMRPVGLAAAMGSDNFFSRNILPKLNTHEALGFGAGGAVGGVGAHYLGKYLGLNDTLKNILNIGGGLGGGILGTLAARKLS